MKSHCKRSLLAAAAALLLVGSGSAQSEPDERVDKAIAAYEKVRKTKKYTQRKRLLGWLGEIEHPRVDDYLRKELKAYQKWTSGSWVVAAIRKQPRPELAADLLAAAKAPASHHTVRVAAIEALGAMGADELDDVLEFATGQKVGGVLGSVLQGLAKVESKAVGRWLARAMQGEDAKRVVFVLQNSRACRGSSEVDRARVRCVREGNLVVAATAWRILVDQGHRRAEKLTIDVLEKVYDKADAASAAELVRGLVIVGDPDFFPALLRFGGVRGAGVKAALKASAERAGKNAELIEFLIEEGIESELPGERTAAKTLLAKAPAAAVAPLVERIRKQLHRDRKSVLEAAAGLHELLARDPTWVNDLLMLAEATDLESRLLGLAMLTEMGSDVAILPAQKYVRHRAWELRSLAYRYLTAARDVSSIPLLIERYGREEGRLAHELETALFKHTGTRCWSRPDWKKWWRKHETGFTLPNPKSVEGGGSTTGGNTISYYDIPLVSSRIAFLVDISGSMKARVGKSQTRLDVAKEQLRNVVNALPKAHKVNLITFETNTIALWDQIESLNHTNKERFLKKVDKLKAAGSTNTYGALELAYLDPEVDTVYLLTDGQPSAGLAVDPDEILEAVQFENRLKQIVIHCISVGRESRLLRDLAKMTGGEYKCVK